MKNTNISKNSVAGKKQGVTGSNHGKKDEKEFLINKKDVDEFDISTEYFTKNKLESDGEDF